MISSLVKTPAVRFGRVASIENIMVAVLTMDKIMVGGIRFGSVANLLNNTENTIDIIIEFIDIIMFALLSAIELKST
jgi:hypothetical protein